LRRSGAGQASPLPCNKPLRLTASMARRRASALTERA